MSTNNILIIIGVVVVIAVVAYMFVGKTETEAERTGTENLSAEQVVDLEVQAEQEFKASGGQYE